MTFLSPWSAIVAGAVAVPLLVLLYLLKLRRRPMRVSSTLLWEQAVKDLHANEPFRWLRPSVLLFLQLAALLCLLLALARPVVPGDAPLGTRLVIIIDASASMNAPASASADSSNLGNRPSSSGESPVAGASPITRFDAARERALEIIDQLARSGGVTGGGAAQNERPQAMIVVASATCRAVTPFTPDVRELRDAVNALRVTDEALSLDELATFVRAWSLSQVPSGVAGDDIEAAATISSSRSVSQSTRAVLISDGGFDLAAWRAVMPRGGMGVGGVRWSFVPALPTSEAVRTRASASSGSADSASSSPPSAQSSSRANQTGNLGIINLSARRQVEDPSTIRVFARVTSSFSSPQRVALVVRVRSATALSAGEDKLGTSEPPANSAGSLGSSPIVRAVTLELPAAELRPDGSRAVSEATASLDVVSADACLITAELSQPDQLGVDNVAGVYMDESRRPRVLVVVPNATDAAGLEAGTVGGAATAGSPADRADAFLMSALDASLLARVRVVDVATFDRGLAMTTAGTVSAGEWASYDVVIFDAAAPLPGRVPPMASISFGAPVPGLVTLSSPDASPAPASSARTTRFLTWERTHPIMRDVKLDTIVARSGRSVEAAIPRTAASPPGSGTEPPPATSSCRSTTLALGSRATGADGSQAQTLIAALECENRAASSTALDASLAADRSTRRVVVGFELAQSNWGPSESFPIFLANALDWVTSESFAGVASSVRTGEASSVGVPAGAASIHLVPIGESVAVQTREINAETEEVRVGPFARAGLYRVVARRADGREVRTAQPVLPVNLLDATESACFQRTALDLGDDRNASPSRGSSTSTSSSDASDSAAAGDRSATGGREVWVWFVYLAAAMLCIEWIVYAWRSRS